MSNLQQSFRLVLQTEEGASVKISNFTSSKMILPLCITNNKPTDLFTYLNKDSCEF